MPLYYQNLTQDKTKKPALLRSTGAWSRPLTAWENRVGFPEEVPFDLALQDESELTGGGRAELSLARGRVGSGPPVSCPSGPAGADGMDQRRAPPGAHCGPQPGGGHFRRAHPAPPFP